MTTVNGEDDVPVCLDACSDTWEEEFFDNLGQEDQGEEQDEEAILSQRCMRVLNIGVALVVTQHGQTLHLTQG